MDRMDYHAGVLSHPVVSNSLWPVDCSPPGSSCLWNFPGKNTGVGCHFLLQGIFPPRNQTPVSGTGRRLFTTVPPGKPPLNHKEWNPAICNDTDGPWGHYANWNKSDVEKQALHVVTYMWNLKNKAKWRPSSQCSSLSRTWLFVTPWTVAHQAPLSMGFSRQEYWSGLPFPSHSS